MASHFSGVMKQNIRETERGTERAQFTTDRRKKEEALEKTRASYSPKNTDI